MSTPTPYLQLRCRLSQIWINKHTIILVLMAMKLLLFGRSFQGALTTSKYYTLASCPTIDSVASNAVSMPHYLSKSANFMIQKSVEQVNEQTLRSLDMMLTISQNMIVFALEMMVGTYACLLVAAVDGAVDVAVNATEDTIRWVNDTLDTITDDIEDGLTDISKYVNKVISAAEKVKDLFDNGDDTTDNQFKKVNLTISGLRDLHIPASINDKLDYLRNNTPDFEEVKNKTEYLISEPFTFVKNQMADTTLFQNDGKSLYVPELESLSVCSNNKLQIEKFYDELNSAIHKFILGFTILLIIGAVMVMIPAFYSEYRKWKRLSQLKNTQDIGKDPIMTYETIFNRYPTKAGVMVSKLSQDASRQTQIRWLMSYIFSSRASIVLGLSLAGFIVIIFQYIIIGVIQHDINDMNSPFNTISDELSIKISDSIMEWTDTTNDYISYREDEMNEKLFSWVQKTTDSVNDTISDFVDDMNSVIAKVFNGSILYDPVKTVMGCVIENKLIKIERGLTWVHDHAEVTFPRVSDEYLALALEDNDGNSITEACGLNRNQTFGDYNQTYNATGFNTTSGYNNCTTDLATNSQMMKSTTALVDSTEEMMKKLLDLTIKSYKEALRLEIWICTALLCIWITQVIIGGMNSWYILYNLKAELDEIPGMNEKLQISHPRELTKEEQIEYGYPYLDPFQDPPMRQTSQSQFSPVYDDPVPKLNKFDSTSTSTMGTEEMENPFETDEFGDGVSSVVSTRKFHSNR